MKRSHLLLAGGIGAPVLYAMAVIVGGLLHPGYSHFTEPISALIATGAPNRLLLNPMFAAYNLLALAFSLGVLGFVQTSKRADRNVGLTAAGFLVGGALIGSATLFFPQDPGGPAVTVIGTFHLVLAGLSLLTSMVSILLLGLWFRRIGLRALARYSFASLLVVFISGGMAAAATASRMATAGLLERITIFGYLQWMSVLGALLPKHAVSHER